MVNRLEKYLYRGEKERKNLNTSSSVPTARRSRSQAWFSIKDLTG
jgi:hypothetical protein